MVSSPAVKSDLVGFQAIYFVLFYNVYMYRSNAEIKTLTLTMLHLTEWYVHVAEFNAPCYEMLCSYCRIQCIILQNVMFMLHNTYVMFILLFILQNKMLQLTEWYVHVAEYNAPFYEMFCSYCIIQCSILQNVTCMFMLQNTMLHVTRCYVHIA